MYDFSSRRGEFRTRRRGNRGFDDDAPTTAKRTRRRSLAKIDETTYGLPEGDRWSTWDQSIPTQRGPRPHPDWLVTDLAAVDTELGILKTGKEADVFLIRRGVPQGRSCLLAAKRYRDAEHRMFHRDSGYLEGRRTRDTRVNRAAASRTAFGRQAIAGQWAAAEFNALSRLYAAGVAVPYPVQVLETELLLEFIGSADGIAAPRLAETRPDPAELAGLWDQLVQALVALARDGLAHGDLSAYNLMVHDGRLVMIDLPQVVDVIANPQGAMYLTRDAENVGRWFTAHGLDGFTRNRRTCPTCSAAKPCSTPDQDDVYPGPATGTGLAGAGRGGRRNHDDGPHRSGAENWSDQRRCSIVVVSGASSRAPGRDQVHHGHHPPPR